MKRGIKLLEKRQAVTARKQSKNVLLNKGTRQQAQAVERAAAENPKDVVTHTGGHELADGSRGLPHAQTEGKFGHTFYSSIIEVLGAGIVVMEIMEELDPFYVAEPGCGEMDCNENGLDDYLESEEETLDEENPKEESDDSDRADFVSDTEK